MWINLVGWPPFGKELLIPLTNMSICNLSCFPFWFRVKDLVLIVQVPGHFISFLSLLTFYIKYVVMKKVQVYIKLANTWFAHLYGKLESEFESIWEDNPTNVGK